MSQNRRTERNSIIQWILTLEQKRMLLEDRFERYRRQINMMVLSFLQEQGVDSGNSWGIARRRISNRELAEFRKQVDLLLSEELTKDGRAEAEKVEKREPDDIADYIVALVALETIRVMNDAEVIIDVLVQDTIRSELVKQTRMIDYDAQYLENHFEEIYRGAMTQEPWSARIWGVYQTELRNSVEQLVRESFVRGFNPKEVAEELKRITERTTYETERLMRTETAKVQAESQLTTYKAQDIRLFDLIPEPDACNKCKEIAKNGPYSVQEAVVGENIEPIHPNCRCSSVGVLD